MDHFKPEPSTINTTQHKSDNGQYPSMRPANPSNPKNLHTTLKVMKQKNLKTPLERLSPTDPDYEVQLENLQMPLQQPWREQQWRVKSHLLLTSQLFRGKM